MSSEWGVLIITGCLESTVHKIPTAVKQSPQTFQSFHGFAANVVTAIFADNATSSMAIVQTCSKLEKKTKQKKTQAFFG